MPFWKANGGLEGVILREVLAIPAGVINGLPIGELFGNLTWVSQ